MDPRLESTQLLLFEDLPTQAAEPAETPPLQTAWSAAPISDPDTVVRLRTPEPAMIRGLLMAVAGITVMLAFRNYHREIEPLLIMYMGYGPLALAWWIRRSVTPTTYLKSGDQ